MSANNRWLIILLVVLAGLTGYNYFFQPFAYLNQPKVVESPPPVIDQDATSALVSTFSTEEKVAQLIAFPLNVSKSVKMSVGQGLTGGQTQTNGQNQASASADLAWITTHNPGVVTLFGSSISTSSAQTATSTITAQTLGQKPKPWIAVDHEGGDVQRLNGEGFTVLPSWFDLCQISSKQEMAETIKKSAQELKAVGVNIVLGPVLDFAPLPQPILRERICSANPVEVSERAQVAVAVYLQQSLQPVIKHFPGIGQVTVDLHKQFATVEVTEKEAQVYRSILDIFPTVGVMTSHAGVSNQYPDIPCSLSLACVGQVTTAFPQTLIFTDALEMKSALHSKNEVASSSARTLSEVSIEAVLAGNHVLVFGPSVTSQDLDKVIDQLAKRYAGDQIFRRRVDDSLKMIIDRKLTIK